MGKDKPPPPRPTVSENTKKVQQDWKNREFMQVVQTGVAELTSFLNEFGAPRRPLPVPAGLFFLRR